MLSVIDCLANFPVSWVEQNFTCKSSGVNRAHGRETGHFLGARRSPSAKFHLSWPVSGLVNMRIWPSHAIDAHSGVFRFLTPLSFKRGIYLPLRGQHTFSVSRLTLLHCNKAPRHRHSIGFTPSSVGN
jgi:hypothetical protein